MDSQHPVVRLHIWLETEGGMFFGSGRAKLLEGIERHGSLQKAAKELGMSYRAAWGKIKQTEKVLGFQLVEKAGNYRDGYRLTEFGRMLKDKFTLWFDEVEKVALAKANEIFPWPARGYRDVTDEERTGGASGATPRGRAAGARGRRAASGPEPGLDNEEDAI
jgi:molybdate transport system regulatory protein